MARPKIWRFEGNKFIIRDIEIEVETIKNFYIIENHSYDETCLKFNLKGDMLCKILNHYNIKKPKELSLENKNKALRETYSNWSEEKRAERKERAKKIWYGLTEEQRKERSLKAGKGVKEAYWKKSEEERNLISDKKRQAFLNQDKEKRELVSLHHKEGWSNMDPLLKEKTISNRVVKWKNTYSKKTDEELKEIGNKISKNSKISWANMPKEDKEKRSALLVEKWKEKTKEELDNIRNKKSSKWTPQLKAQMGNKISQILNNRSPEEIKSFVNKNYSTRKLHNTFNTSQPEENFYQSLLQIFPKEDIFRQYKDPRYPFNCDFYIKSKDLFIELNFHFSHGEHPFNPYDSDDKLILEEWENKSKNSQFYKNCIDVWTKKDPEKQKIAKENNLNYICFYKEQEMLDFLNNLI